MKRVHPLPHAKAGKAPKTKPVEWPSAKQIAPAKPGRPNIATAAFGKKAVAR